MGFKMSCDRCGRFIKNVKVKDLRQLPEEIVCKKCTDLEASVSRGIVKIKQRAEHDFKLLADKYKDLITEYVKKEVNGDT